MIRPLVVAVVSTVLALAAPPSHACSKRHQSVFELYELATSVAIVKVRAVTPSPERDRLPAGPVELGVVAMLKGDARTRTLVAIETNTSCHVGFRVGHEALVFLDAKGYPVGAYEGYKEDVAALQPVMRSWAGARDAAARLAILLDAIAAATPGGYDVVADDAALFLVDEPELLAALAASSRDDLAAVAKTARKTANVHLVVDRLNAASSFEREVDPARLADAIVHGRGEHDPDRIAAFERCERVHGKRLDRYSVYRRGVSKQFWLELAAACRTGTRAR